jgi:hypothetical protein
VSSRGVFIGQIIDDLDAISNQVRRRCELGQTDLNSLLENFFRDILNLTLNTNLVNLNARRSNAPGLDLGDKTSPRKIAYQITSRADAAKVTDTLRKITKEQVTLYDEFFILVIGERRKNYTIDPKLAASRKGFSETNVLGISDLCRRVMDTNLETIRAIQQKLQLERTEIRIELEPEINGTFETNITDLVEGRPNVTRSDASLLVASDAGSGVFGSADEAAAALNGFIDRLEPLPRLSRALLGWMIDESEHRYGFNDYHVVNADLVQRKYPDTQNLLVDTRLLEAWGFLSYDDDQDGKSARFSFSFPGADHGWFAEAFMNFVKEQKLSAATLFSTMNFSAFGLLPVVSASVTTRAKKAGRVKSTGRSKAQQR